MTSVQKIARGEAWRMQEATMEESSPPDSSTMHLSTPEDRAVVAPDTADRTSRAATRGSLCRISSSTKCHGDHAECVEILRSWQVNVLPGSSSLTCLKAVLAGWR